jgi:hypothetical protein
MRAAVGEIALDTPDDIAGCECPFFRLRNRLEVDQEEFAAKRSR